MMKESATVKLGFLPTRRNVFDPVEAGRYKDIIREKLRSYNVEIVDINSLNEEGMIFDVIDAQKAANIFIQNNVDAIFAPHCNFGTEDAVAKVGKLVGKPFLLWGPQDEAANENGFRKRDSQCGLFATSKALHRYGVPFSYIVNSDVQSKTFDKGFQDFIRTANAVKAVKTARVGQIGTRPERFQSVMVNEPELLERFGIEVVPTSIVDLKLRMDKILSGRPEEYEATVEYIRRDFTDKTEEKDSISKIAAMKCAIKEWANEREVNSIAIQCWDALQAVTQVYPCFVNALLADEGLPAACETDVLGAVSVSMLQAAGLGKSPAFLADLTTRHPDNPNAELLWHCGNFPPSLAKDEKIIGQQTEGPYDGAGRWQIDGEKITIAKMDGMGGKYFLLMGHAQETDGPSNAGTYMWAQFDNWPKWERKIIYGPYIHHVGVIKGQYAPALYDACRYIEGLEPDPVEPDKQQLEDYFLY